MPKKTAAAPKDPATKPPAKRGRRSRDDAPTPNRADLIRAVLVMEKRDGPGSLSMRKLASEVGVSPRLLYTMVKNKEELYELAAASMLDRWTLPDTNQSWKERFATIIKKGLELSSEYPELARHGLLNSLDHNYPESASRIVNALRDCMLEAGLSIEETRQIQLLYNTVLLGALDLARNYSGNDQPYLLKELKGALDVAFSRILAGAEPK